MYGLFLGDAIVVVTGLDITATDADSSLIKGYAEGVTLYEILPVVDGGKRGPGRRGGRGPGSVER